MTLNQNTCCLSVLVKLQQWLPNLSKKEVMHSMLLVELLNDPLGFLKHWGGNQIKFEDVLSGFNNYEVIFVATTAPYFLVSFDRMKDCMKNRKSGTMILDLSNPRTVDEKVATIPGIKLMNIDQIAEMIDKNMKNRRGKVSTVENIISEEVPIIEATMKRLDAEPFVKDVFTNADSLRIKELQKALQMLGETDEKKNQNY